jgi:hypothetical protein
MLLAPHACPAPWFDNPRQNLTFSSFITRLGRSVKSALRTLADIIYGASVYEMVRDLHKERAHLEHLFILIVFGDILGIPILPPYYTLHLLPYVAPNITGWKRSMLHERDLTDLCDQEIG